MRLVIHPAVDAHRLDAIRRAGGKMQVTQCLSDDDAEQAIADADAFFGKLTPRLLAAASNLQWVQSPTASLEHYLFPELIEHPCRLSNMRGLFSDVIADHVLGFMLSFARNLHIYRDRQRERLWAPVGGEGLKTSLAAGPGEITPIDLRHRRLADCTLGVIGIGGIGAEVCRRGAACGMTVFGIDPRVRCVPGAVERVWPLERLDDLLQASDFLVIAAPHTPRTEKMFRREQLKRMKHSACLVNVGRGAIVDLEDLTAALQNGTIAGAALDVFETEPLPGDHPLWGMENVLITPHMAAASPIVPQRHLATLVENVRRFSQGEEPLNVVDKHEWC
jgi:phosphoglycerate dehydrogenase-like enzyme